MAFRVDEARFEACSRVAGVAVAAYAMRSMERWRANLTDHDCVMIMIAVIAIGAERLLRTEFPAEYRSLAAPMDQALLAKVNIASIAHATGLNRETARRKVNDLIEQGELVRDPQGNIAFAPGLLQSDRIRDQVRGQVGELAAIANQLARMDILVADD